MRFLIERMIGIVGPPEKLQSDQRVKHSDPSNPPQLQLMLVGVPQD